MILLERDDPPESPRGSIGEHELLNEPMGVVRLHIERCTTTGRKKAISKGHQVIRSSVI